VADTQRKAVLSFLLAAAFSAVQAFPTTASNLETTPSSTRFLPIDEDANEEIARIGRLVAQQKWREVIGICQKYIAGRSKAVVEIRKGIYGSARILCEDKLRRLPGPAKLLYRTLYDPAAEKLYRLALAQRDEAAARKLVSQFAVTSHGPNGMKLLAGLLFEKGDFRGALGCWLRWMDAVARDALPEQSRRLVAAKAAVAAARLGDRDALAKALKLFGANGAVVSIGGARIARAEELSKLASSLRTQATEAVHEAPPAVDLIRWQAPLEDKYSARVSQYYGSGVRLGYNCHGRLSGGMLYLNSAEGPRAFDVLTGRLVWRRTGRNYDSDQYGSFRSFNFHCRVYPGVDRPGRQVVYTSGGVRLGAHDAKTGRSLWTKSRASFSKVQPIGNNPELRVAFSSPVVCHGRNAYVMLETAQGDVYLLSLDRATGAVRWAADVGGSGPISGYRVSFPADILPLGSSLVFCTGRGVIGKLDATTAEVQWLVPYRRRAVFAKNYYRLRSPLRYSPMAAVGDSVVCMPADGGELIAIRASDGHVKWRKELTSERYFLGALKRDAAASSDRLFVVGRDVKCLRADTGSVLWTWPLPEGSSSGLGQITNRGVIVATHKAVYVIDAVSGELSGFLPLPSFTGEAANVVSDGSSVALLSNNLVSVVGAKVQTRRLLARALRDVPGDPWVLAAWARLLRSEGKAREALERLAEAARIAGKKRETAKLAAALEREMVGLHHKLYLDEWKAGRRIEAFRHMRRALCSPGRIPYECKLGYRREPAAGATQPHTLVMASGDRVRGRLVAVESGTLTFVVGNTPWRIAAAGVRRVVVRGSLATRAGEPNLGAHVVLSNGDRISATVVSLKDSRLRLRAAFGEFRLGLSGVAVIAFGGRPQNLIREGVYIRTRGGNELSGYIRAFDGTDFILDIPFCGKHRIPADDICTISNRRRMPPRSAGPGDPGGIIRVRPSW